MASREARHPSLSVRRFDRRAGIAIGAGRCRPDSLVRHSLVTDLYAQNLLRAMRLALRRMRHRLFGGGDAVFHRRAVVDLGLGGGLGESRRSPSKSEENSERACDHFIHNVSFRTIPTGFVLRLFRLKQEVKGPAPPRSFEPAR